MCCYILALGSRGGMQFAHSAGTWCWLLTDPTAALSISRDAQTAAGHKHSAASCSSGKLHLVQTQGRSPDRMNPHLGVSALTPLSQKKCNHSSSFSAKCFTSGDFFMLLCFLSEKFKFFKIQPAQEFRARYHQVYVKKYFNTVSENVRQPCSNKF